ncbi:hypothetical protein Gorai_016175, partial [Gossypium raimondii]|nr:hypothetical protein [Gossypium raimondii]
MGGSEVRWQPPVGPSVKVNFDASFQSHSRPSYSGIIVRMKWGASIQMHSNVPNAFVVEALAFVRVVCFKTDLGFMHVIIEGDSLAVVKKGNRVARHLAAMGVARSVQGGGKQVRRILFRFWDASPLALAYCKTFPIHESLAGFSLISVSCSEGSSVFVAFFMFC